MSRIYMARFPNCGHRRSSKNTNRQGRCRTCLVASAKAMSKRALSRRLRVSLLFPECGHRRRPSNPGPKCGICAEAKWRKCQHPRTKSNTYTPKDGRPTCRTCRNFKAKQWRATHDDPRYAVHRVWKNPPPSPRPLPSEITPVEQPRAYSLFPLKRRTA